MAGFVALIAVLLIALYVCWLMFQPFLNVLMWAAVLAVVFYPDAPPHPGADAQADGRGRHLHAPGRALHPAARDVHHRGRRPRADRRGRSRSRRRITRWNVPMPSAVTWLLERVGQYVDIDIDRESARKFLAERMQTWGTALAASTLMVVGGAVGAVTQMLLVVFTLFYFFRDGERIRQAAYEMVPLQRVQWQDIISRTQGRHRRDRLRRAGDRRDPGHARHVHLLGARAAVAAPLGRGDVLPVDDPDGRRVSRVDAGGDLSRADRLATQAGILVVWGIVVIGGIDNILSPRLVGRRASLHELLIFFAVLGGLQVFGVLGLILGPVVVAMTLALIEMVRQAGQPPSETLPQDTVMEEQAKLRDVG